MRTGDYAKAERLAREAIRMLTPLGDRGYLCESQRILAELLVEQGKVDEAERYALQAVETVGAQDVTSLPTTWMALGRVGAARGKDEEAETLLHEAVERAEGGAPGWIVAGTVARLARFLRTRGRGEEADDLEARIEPRASVG